MPKDLAAILLEDGAVSAEALARAQARQHEAGGALDTALLEVGALGEDVLAERLARAAELPAAPASAWEGSDARARRVFPSRVAERHGLAPFALDGRELSLVATYPVDLELLDEISFMLSLHLTPHVGPEWRVRELIHRLYGTPLPRRLAALAASAGAGAPRGEELPAAPEPAPAREAPEPAEPPPASAVPGFERDGSEPREPLAAALQQALDSVDPSLFDADAPGGGFAEEPEPPGPPPDRSAPPRWSLADARAALAAAQRRDEVVLVALRYARDFFEYAAVFAVTRDAVAGHDALGMEDERDRARSVALYSSDPGIFKTVIETRSPYLGPVTRDAAGNATILDGLGRGTPRTVLVHPVLLRDRPVCIVYADNGEAPVSPRRLGDLLLLLSTAGGAFERIIRERKTQLRGPRADAPPGAAPPGPPAVVDAAPPEGMPALDLSVELAPASAPAAGSFGGGPATDDIPVAPELAGEVAPEVPPAAESGGVAVEAAAETSRAAPRPPGTAESLGALEDRFFTAGAPAPEAAPEETERPAAAASPADVASPAAEVEAEVVVPADRPAPRPAEPLSPAALADRVLDPDPAVSSQACTELGERRREPTIRPASEKLRRALLSGLSGRATRAARALGALRDVEAIPLLIQVLETSEPDTAGAAADALAAITLQRLGPDARRWLGWWKQNRGRGRAEWLFSGLTSADRDTRLAASTELSQAAPPPEPYSADAAAPDRERVARAWAGWWARSGHVI